MFGSTLRSLLFAGLCSSVSCNIAEDQIVFEAQGSPVLRRFNVSSHAQLKKTLDKAQVRTPCVGTSDTLMMSPILELRPRCLASYPNPRRYLLPLQFNSSTHQATVRGLPGPRLRAYSDRQFNERESSRLGHVILQFDLPFVLSSAFRDRNFHFGLGQRTPGLGGGRQHRSLWRTTGNDCSENLRR